MICMSGIYSALTPYFRVAQMTPHAARSTQLTLSGGLHNEIEVTQYNGLCCRAEPPGLDDFAMIFIRWIHFLYSIFKSDLSIWKLRDDG